MLALLSCHTVACTQSRALSGHTFSTACVRP
jgi:hypothetical protein